MGNNNCTFKYPFKCQTILTTDLGGLQLDDEGQYEREVGDYHLYLYLCLCLYLCLYLYLYDEGQYEREVGDCHQSFANSYLLPTAVFSPLCLSIFYQL